MNAPFIPEIPDEGTETLFFDNGIPGQWLDALRFVHFTVSDFEPVHESGDDLANRDRAGSAPFHSQPSSTEGQHDHVAR